MTVSADGLEPAPRSSTFGREELVVRHIVLDREIGAGGMGSVWCGEHTTLRAPVAVKFLRPSLIRHPVAVARFQREAAAAARLRSSNVVQVFDHGITASGIPYIVMEWLEGISLQERWEAEGQLSVAETLEIVRQTARALARAHAIGIVHRDIKPDNVFLTTSDGELTVKVLDFGIAKMIEGDDIDRVTADGLVIGTPHFMSPEQMVGSPDVGPAADIWALGVVAYGCLTGRLPYDANNVASLALAMEHTQPTPVRELVPEVPPALGAWIHRALELDASRRFPDGRSALEALDRALGRDASGPQGWGSRPRIEPTIGLAHTVPERTPSAPDQATYVIRASAAPPPVRGRWYAGAIAALMVACLGFAAAKVSPTERTLAVRAASGPVDAPREEAPARPARALPEPAPAPAPPPTPAPSPSPSELARPSLPTPSFAGTARVQPRPTFKDAQRRAVDAPLRASVSPRRDLGF